VSEPPESRQLSKPLAENRRWSGPPAVMAVSSSDLLGQLKSEVGAVCGYVRDSTDEEAPVEPREEVDLVPPSESEEMMKRVSIQESEDCLQFENEGVQPKTTGKEPAPGKVGLEPRNGGDVAEEPCDGVESPQDSSHRLRGLGEDVGREGEESRDGTSVQRGLPSVVPLSSVDVGSLQSAATEVSRFLTVSNEEIGEAWRRHVASIGRAKSGAEVVHTHFLFSRLFPVLRQQCTVLTREACNYLGHAYNAIASHFLVTVELLGSQLQLPSVYVDSELLVQTRLIDAHVFLSLEMDGNLDAYYERRRTVVQRLEHIKLQLRQQSRGQKSEEFPEEHLEALSLSPEQATLKLCQAVHRLHFQLLVLLGSYVKLLHSLQPYVVTSGVSCPFVVVCFMSCVCVCVCVGN
jgi:hypothetical protein